MSLNDKSADLCREDPRRDEHPVAERTALLRALARRDECLARRRNYTGHSLHVRRKLDAALRAAESDVAILRYALGEGPGDPEV